MYYIFSLIFKQILIYIYHILIRMGLTAIYSSNNLGFVIKMHMVLMRLKLKSTLVLGINAT